MDHEAICARYALALAVLPDHDVAGDLFMQAKSDQDLLRLANQWRVRRGLGEVTAAPVLVHPLTEADQEQALHLFRRGQKMRRARAFGYILITAAALGGVALWALPKPARDLAAAAAFRGSVVQSANHDGGYRVGVYRMEAAAGKVTVWWQLTGWGADRLAPQLRPELTLTGASTSLPAAQTEQEAPRHDRVYLKSSFRTFVTTAESARLTVTAPDGRSWEVAAPLNLEQLDAEQTIPLNQTASIGPSTVVIDSVTLSATSTVVKYHAPGAGGLQPARLIAVLHDGLQSVPSRSLSRGGQASGDQYTFGALPVGATEISLLFSGPVEALGPQTIALPSPSVVETEIAPGERALSVTLAGDLRLDDLHPPYVQDAAGHRYETSPPFDVVTGSYTRFTVKLSGLPPHVALVSLHLPLVYRSHPAGVVKVDLSEP